MPLTTETTRDRTHLARERESAQQWLARQLAASPSEAKEEHGASRS